MNTSQNFSVAAIVIASSLLSACGTTTTTTITPVSAPISTPVSSTYGVIDSIQLVQVETEKKNSGVGAVAGGVIGGALGNTVGGGAGKALATVAGVVGGAVVGNKIEENGDAPQVHQSYQIVVRMDTGGYQTVTQDAITDMQVGSRVHVENNRVYLL
jgi:outer membrane lipoprotein SlyB